MLCLVSEVEAWRVVYEIGSVLFQMLAQVQSRSLQRQNLQTGLTVDVRCNDGGESEKEAKKGYLKKIGVFINALLGRSLCCKLIFIIADL